MAFYLEKEKTGSTPYILIDEKNNFMKFEGESFNENVITFFQDVNDWLADYLNSGFSKFTFECNLHYFNSSTAKLLFNILMNLDEYAAQGKEIIVNWIVKQDNDIIIECGEDFEEEMNNLKFNLIIVT